MERQHEGYIRGYERNSKAWYAKANSEDRTSITMGMYRPDGRTNGEVLVEWQELGGNQCAILKVFEDSWNVLSLFNDLIHRMGQVDSELIQEEDFCKLLNECGFTDLTAYTNPHRFLPKMPYNTQKNGDETW